ncbi:poly-gamma-glutamate hydrolase family protein [Staphylococcus saccharolyticus]|uniref:Phage-related replication protein n=1 Tax=Staphylococcus saccharolyticus TaxID=33028 RepID=A0A380GXF2_9STAP|nr:poly-gamma-glutamate hydrolase family protein [Staphylococcus saccharolyticus]SUM67902.1 Phage-related replication protein [Staphylococcus saccharolyticus]
MKDKQSLSSSRKKKSLLIIASLITFIGIGSGYEYVHSNEEPTNEISSHRHLFSHLIPGFNLNTDKEGSSYVNLESSDTVQEDIHHKDYFKSMTQLLMHITQGVDWKKEIKKVGSHVLIIAPHGGNLEAGTTELTKYISNHHHYDYYSFTVLRKHHVEGLHVTSGHYITIRNFLIW